MLRRVTVKVKLFAMLRERAGRGEVSVEAAEGATVDEVSAQLAELAGLGDLLTRMTVVTAVNREYVPGDTRLRDGDELALIPPVSGGAEPPVHARVTTEPLSADRLCELVRDDAAGAIVCFQGTTRDVNRLDYEAYPEMAQSKIEKILREVAVRHGLLAAAAEHRHGAVPLAETSVVVAVSAPHRGEAFAGAREALDRIKSEAPIWKSEVVAGDGGETATWVEGVAPPVPQSLGRPAGGDR